MNALLKTLDELATYFPVLNIVQEKNYIVRVDEDYFEDDNAYLWYGKHLICAEFTTEIDHNQTSDSEYSYDHYAPSEGTTEVFIEIEKVFVCDRSEGCDGKREIKVSKKFKWALEAKIEQYILENQLWD